MPALQVREFPDDLYEELRVFAARHHRSMAQQTVASVEAAIRQERAESYASRLVPFELPSQREARLAKRRMILERASRRKAERAEGIPSPLTMLEEARAERDSDFDRVIGEVMREVR